MPLHGPGDVGGNPFYSERLQGELRLLAMRPRELPDDGAQPVADAGLCGSDVEANGKSRGDGTVMFKTPSSWKEACRPVTYGPPGTYQQLGLQSQGMMPREPVMAVPQTMGVMKQPDQQAESSGADELQRALEGELVDFLRQQNSKLSKEVAELKSAVESQKSSAAAATSPSSTVRGSSVGDGPGRRIVPPRDG